MGFPDVLISMKSFLQFLDTPPPFQVYSGLTTFLFPTNVDAKDSQEGREKLEALDGVG
jgi:hypothetical protein